MMRRNSNRFCACACVVLGILCGAGALGAVDKPPALVGLESARARLHTGRVVWSTHSNLPQTRDDFIPRWHFYDVPRYFVSRFTADEYMVEDHGDPEGVVSRNADGVPHPELGYHGMRYLVVDGAQWELRDRAALGRVHRGRSDVIDVRAFGLAAGLPLGDTYHGLAWGRGEDRTYAVRVVDGLHEVTASLPDKEWSIRWLIDPERGWNAVGVTVQSHGEVVNESRTTLKQYGDLWFPETVEFYERDFKQGQEPVYVMRVLSAEFNDPDHPRRLTPASIGVEVGTNLQVFEADDPFHPVGRFGWDTKKLVPLHELHRRIEAGELEQGPIFILETDRAIAKGQWLSQLETGWERYTRRFIERYGLDSEQAQKAWAVLEECQRRAQAYVSAHKDEFETIGRRVRDLSQSETPHVADQTGELGVLKTRMLRLEAPIARVFYSQLVPRLDRLPTRAQRKAVEGREPPDQKP
jgi:hypothetical protein